MIDYNKRSFVLLSNSGNGALEGDTKFIYQQEGNIVTCTYFGSNIIRGHLIALVGVHGELDMRYHQVSRSGVLMTGTCSSTPEIMSTGKIRLHEKWKWTSGDYSEGYSILEEQ
jgi:hypothetical protein